MNIKNTVLYQLIPANVVLYVRPIPKQRLRHDLELLSHSDRRSQLYFDKASFFCTVWIIISTFIALSLTKKKKKLRRDVEKFELSVDSLDIDCRKTIFAAWPFSKQNCLFTSNVLLIKENIWGVLVHKHNWYHYIHVTSWIWKGQMGSLIYWQWQKFTRGFHNLK